MKNVPITLGYSQIVDFRDSMNNKAYSNTLRASPQARDGTHGDGDKLTIADLDISVQIYHQDDYRIDEETLLSLGVAKDIVDKAKVYWKMKNIYVLESLRTIRLQIVVNSSSV